MIHDFSSETAVFVIATTALLMGIFGLAALGYRVFKQLGGWG